VDPITLYIEGIGPTVTIDGITQHFSHFGQVTYVSLPRFEVSRHSKGFCFIEFADASGAAAAVDAAASGTLGSLRGDHGDAATPLRLLMLAEWKKLRALYSALVKQSRAEDRTTVDAADCGLWAVSRSTGGAAAVPSRDPTHPTARAAIQAQQGVLAQVHGVPDKMNKARLRERVAGVATVEYVDFKKGSVRAVLRCGSKADRDAVIAAFPKPAASADGGHLDAFYVTAFEADAEAAYMVRLGASSAPAAAIAPSSSRDKRPRDHVDIATATAAADGSSDRQKRPRKKDRVHIKFDD
jgi:hypothetical protein